MRRQTNQKWHQAFDSRRPLTVKHKKSEITWDKFLWQSKCTWLFWVVQTLPQGPLMPGLLTSLITLPLVSSAIKQPGKILPAFLVGDSDKSQVLKLWLHWQYSQVQLAETGYMSCCKGCEFCLPCLANKIELSKMVHFILFTQFQLNNYSCSLQYFFPVASPPTEEG